MLIVLLIPSWDKGCTAFNSPRSPRLGVPDPSAPSPPKWLYPVFSSTDLLGNIFCMIGLLYAGSGLYIVSYSSVILWTAIFSVVFMGTILSPGQWAAVFMVFGGLCVSAFNSSHSATGGSNVLFGISCTLLGTFFHAVAYVLGEKFVKVYKIEGRWLVTIVGAFGAAVLLLWQVIWVIPNWDRLIVEPMAARGSSAVTVLITFAILVGSGSLHSASYIALLNQTGAVATGLLQALRAVAVFIFSALLFCDHAPEQCITFTKGISAAVVVSGVFLYAISKGSSGNGNFPRSLSSMELSLSRKDIE